MRRLRRFTDLDLAVVDDIQSNDRINITPELHQKIHIAIKKREIEMKFSRKDDCHFSDKTIPTKTELEFEMEFLYKRFAELEKRQPFIPAKKSDELIGGDWQLVQNWRPCPIGKLTDSNDQLDLNIQFDDYAWLHEKGWLYIPINPDSNMNFDPPDVEMEFDHSKNAPNNNQIILF